MEKENNFIQDLYTGKMPKLPDLIEEMEYCACGAELCELGREYGVCQDCK